MACPESDAGVFVSAGNGGKYYPKGFSSLSYMCLCRYLKGNNLFAGVGAREAVSRSLNAFSQV